MRPVVPSNVDLILAPSPEDASESLSKLDILPDLVVIDGLERKLCSEAALAAFGPTPLYILDNSDWYLRAAEVFRHAGFVEIKFSGFGPVNNYAWCTSLWTNAESISRLHRTRCVALTPAGLAAEDTEERQDAIGSAR